MPRSGLGLHCLPMSHKKDARLKRGKDMRSIYNRLSKRNSIKLDGKIHLYRKVDWCIPVLKFLQFVKKTSLL